MSEKYLIHTVQNAMQILQLFTTVQKEWTLSEIAEAKKMSPATAYRLLKTLENYDYLKRDKKTKKYKLGLSILRLSGIVKATMELYQEARETAEELAEELGEAVHIGVLEETETVYLNKIESFYPVRLVSSIGKKTPSYCSGCGKVILAYKKEKEKEDTIHQIETEGFISYASNTVQTSEQLREDLIEIKEQGYAVCVNELSEGVTSIAAPIFDHTGEIIAGISVTGPNQRLSFEQAISSTVKAGQIISQNLGHYVSEVT